MMRSKEEIQAMIQLLNEGIEYWNQEYEKASRDPLLKNDGYIRSTMFYIDNLKTKRMMLEWVLGAEHRFFTK
jgi:hypothetical protein